MARNSSLSQLSVRFRKGYRYIDLTVTFGRERGKITAICRELGTAQFASTLDEAEEAIIEAIGLQLNALDDTEELERFCREHGIQIYEETPRRWSVVSEAEPIAV